jgi:hypothetical protein
MAQSEPLQTTIGRDSIMIGEQVEWLFKIEVNDKAQVAFAHFEEPKMGAIEILRELPVDTLSHRKGTRTLRTGFVITSFDSGIYELPEIPVQIVRNGTVDTLYFKSVTLKVNTVAVDTTAFQPFDVKPPVKYPYTFKEIVWPWGVTALAAAMLLALAIYVILRVAKKKPVFAKDKPKEPPHVTALRELEKIKAEKLWQNNKVKQYYTRVTDVLRVYMEERYRVQAMEQTSDEILQALAAMTMPDELLHRLRDLLSVSDLVKFAKFQPMTDENEKALATVQEFVDRTKEDLKPEELPRHD